MRRRPAPGLRHRIPLRPSVRRKPLPKLATLRSMWSARLSEKVSLRDAQAYEYAALMGREAFLRQFVGSRNARTAILRHFGWVDFGWPEVARLRRVA